ncbi:MAG: metal-dependent hydrolase [Nitrospirota bacterium]
MDSITHIITGAVMSGPAKEKIGWTGAAALLIGSFMPDIDLVLGVFGNDFYFRYHRVITNSFLGMLLIPPLTALVIWKLSNYPDFKVIYLLVLTAYVPHVFMDFTNSYGCTFLWPLSRRWYALDIVFIVDPWITGLLVIGLAMMLLKIRPMPVAIACFALLFCYWGLRAYTHSAAIGHFKSLEPAARVGAFPAPVNPFKWKVVSEYDNAFRAGWYNVITRQWQDNVEYPKKPENEAVRKAKQAPNAKNFLEFARFPWISFERAGDGWDVKIQDLRFSLKSSDKRFVAEVFVADDGKILKDKFNF